MKTLRISISKASVFLLLLLILLNSNCKRDTASPLTHADSLKSEYNEMKNIIYQVFKTGAGNTSPYYLWYDKVKSVNLDSFSDPYTLLDTLRYKTFDRFSYIASKSEQNQLFNEGQYIGIGCGFKVDGNNLLRIDFVFNDSPLSVDSVKRGWILRSVNGVSIDPSKFTNAIFGKNALGVTNTLVFEDLNSTEHTIIVAKKLITMNTVLCSKVIQNGNRKTGYLAFESYLEPSIAELNSAFTYFKNQEINELVIDLRYNGGGRVDVADSLASSIAGDIARGKVFANLSYNNLHSNSNTRYNLAGSKFIFGLSRIFFITSEGTASASELTINGLKPFMNVYQVGAKTYGKPVGMSGFESKNYDLVLMPIIFQVTNGNGTGGYFNGITPDSNVSDDLLHALGDPQESCLSAILSFIQNGIFPPATKSLNFANSWNIQQIRGLRSEIGAF